MLIATIIFFVCTLALLGWQDRNLKAIRRLKHEIRASEVNNEQLSERIRLYALAQGISHLGIWDIEVATNTIRWSDELYNIYGFKDKNFLPNDTLNEQVIAPEHREKVIKALVASIARKTSFAIEYQIIQPSGTRKYVLGQGMFVEQEGRLVGAIQDITELKEATLKLKINESLLREAETVSHSGSWEWLEGRTYLLLSDEMYNIHGYLPHSVFVDLYFYIKLVYFDDRLEFVKSFNKARKNRRPFKINYRIVRPSGEIRHVLSTAEYKRIGLNDKFAYIGNTQDVTELREAQVQLEEKVIELNRSNRDLEQFAYIASHDLKEPLRKIRSFGERLEKRLYGRLDSETNDYLGRMNDAAKRMSILINDLLAFSKTTRDPKKFVKVELKAIVEQAIRQLDFMSELKSAIIEVSVDQEIYGIESQLVQLFQNLIGNSLKFTRPNVPSEIRLKADLKYGWELKISEINANQLYCIVEISDNGIGFEDDDALRIFDLFFRLHSKVEYDGTGIGLAICKRITDNHSGFISAASNEKNHGAVFTVVLPKNH